MTPNGVDFSFSFLSLVVAVCAAAVAVMLGLSCLFQLSCPNTRDQYCKSRCCNLILRQSCPGLDRLSVLLLSALLLLLHVLGSLVPSSCLVQTPEISTAK